LAFKPVPNGKEEVGDIANQNALAFLNLMRRRTVGVGCKNKGRGRASKLSLNFGKAGAGNAVFDGTVFVFVGVKKKERTVLDKVVGRSDACQARLIGRETREAGFDSDDRFDLFDPFVVAGSFEGDDGSRELGNQEVVGFGKEFDASGGIQVVGENFDVKVVGIHRFIGDSREYLIRGNGSGRVGLREGGTGFEEEKYRKK